MLLVGLTGGIGSGKSTVAALLAELGAVVIDADELARRAMDPGSPALARALDEFGSSIIGPDGTLDRAALAARVFGDADARRLLESIVHPEVARLFGEAVAPHRGTDRVVVYDVPLLVENGLQDAFDVVVVVRAGEDARVKRLSAARGMSEEDARRRMAAQAGDAERERVADVILPNDGTVEDLRRRVKDLWAALPSRSLSSGR